MAKIMDAFLVDGHFGQMQKVVEISPAEAPALKKALQEHPDFFSRNLSIGNAQTGSGSALSVLMENGMPVNVNETFDDTFLTFLRTLGTENMGAIPAVVLNEIFTGGPDPMFR